METQQNNRGDNVRLTYKGESRTIREWEKHLGFPRTCIWQRLRRGWSIEESLTMPLKTKKEEFSRVH